jgi:hypothetical protein
VTPDPRTVAAAQAALDDVVDVWMSRPGVVSVEVARRRTGDLTTDTPTTDTPTADTDDRADAIVIRVTVHPDAPIPDLPDELDGVPVEVIGGMPYAPE